MAACSGTLAAFFESSSTLYSREYHVENVDGKNLKKIVNCCYTGKITLDHDCVVDIKKVANQLGLTYLDAKCDEYFAGKLSCENCVPYYYMCADGLCVWKTKTFEMICKEFKRLTPYHLQQMEIELILHVLRSNKIDAPEELVFGKIKDWVASNEAKRAQYIPGLMNNIRFERIDEIFLIEQIDKYCEIYNCAQIVKDEYRRRGAPQPTWGPIQKNSYSSSNSIDSD